MGILDQIIDNNRGSVARDFEPLVTVNHILGALKERDRHILSKRHGLAGHEEQTLEKIGKQLQLTRERVRQIEKSLLKQLKVEHEKNENLTKAKDLINSIISDHGGLMAEADLLELLGIEALEEANAVKFLLRLITEVESVQNHEHIKEAWRAVHFNVELFNEFVSVAREVLETTKKPHSSENFLVAFKQTDFYSTNQHKLSDKVIINFLNAAKHVSKNAYGEFGLASWRSINPRDVGDKAYLVLKHHKNPEHYTKITDLINAYHDGSRKAYKETVHNELIKDKRFVLVGRGIYGLAEWGYKPGVVADVIEDILNKSGEPLTRSQIIDEVLKQRMVQRNTILVGLSNRNKFKKVGRDRYELVK